MSVAIFILDKINLKSKTVMRQNGHYMMIKRDSSRECNNYNYLFMQHQNA